MFNKSAYHVDLSMYLCIISTFMDMNHAFFFFNFFYCISSTKPQEYKARLEKCSEIKKEPLGHSKQADFIKLMEQEVTDSWNKDMFLFIRFT